MKKIIILTISIIISVLNFIPVAHASDTLIKVDIVDCNPGETVEVKLSISGNTGIAGAVLKVSYDSELELLSVTKGDALSELVFTPPAKMTSNPITLLWDGIDSDASNGTLVTLQFKVPIDTEKKYDIKAFYDIGGIYDGAINDLDVDIQNGYIDTTQKPEINVSGDSSLTISLTSPQEITGTVYSALYDSEGRVLEAKAYIASATIPAHFDNISAGSYYKVMWWNDELKPFCKAKVIDLTN